MKRATQTCLKTLRRAPWVLACLLAGCMGHNGLTFPWSQTQEVRESRLEHVTTATFADRVLKCDRPVLVDFYAEWCGPCKQLGPVLEDFAKEHPEVRVVKVDVDKNSDLAGRYEVRAMPSLLAIRGGKVMSRSIGVVTKEKMLEMTKETAPL